ncbi:MAG: NYN domain-containing protein [Laribacter sp.]|nr:NYN domain-containing protein [Laribacter sp.]MBP9608791.1 NYN domain-containing protein [Laribacter sp.]
MATAILIDGAFFLHRYRALVADAATHTADDVADTLVRWSLAHLNQQDERRDLYRIFFYDCPPLTKKVHTPVGNVLRDFAESPEARFRTTLHEALSRKRKLVLRRGQLADFNQWNIKPMVQRQILKGERGVDDLRDDDFIYDVRQNGIDTLMALDVAGIVYKKLADQVVLFAADADFVPLAQLVRPEGIDLVLDPMWKPVAPELFNHIDGLRSTCPRPVRELGANGNA